MEYLVYNILNILSCENDFFKKQAKVSNKDVL